MIAGISQSDRSHDRSQQHGYNRSQDRSSFAFVATKNGVRDLAPLVPVSCGHVESSSRSPDSAPELVVVTAWRV